MSMRLNKHGYEQLIAGNIRWLDQQPRTLERDHTRAVLLASIAHEYPDDERADAERVPITAEFVFLATEQLRAAVEPFRCDTFGCETEDTIKLDKACAEVDRVLEVGLRKAAAKSREAAIASAVQAEREACARLCDAALDREKLASPTTVSGTMTVVDALGKAIRARNSAVHIVGKWVAEPFGMWWFVVDSKYLAAVSTNINRWFTYSPANKPGEFGHAENLDAGKRAAEAALVKQGWYQWPAAAADSGTIDTGETAGPRADCEL